MSGILLIKIHKIKTKSDDSPNEIDQTRGRGLEKMEKFIRVIRWILVNHKNIVQTAIFILTAVMWILNQIPGNQGESHLKDIITRLKSC